MSEVKVQRIERSEDPVKEPLIEKLKRHADRVSRREDPEIMDLKEHLFPEITIDK